MYVDMWTRVCLEDTDTWRKTDNQLNMQYEIIPLHTMATI